MKKLFFILFFAFVAIFSYSQTNVNNFTNMSEVINCEGMTKEVIYSNIMQNWSTLNGANQKGTNSLDYCDKDAGVINIKTKIYLGWHKVNMLAGYDGYADALITYKIKNGRYKVTLTTNTVTFVWSAANHDSETININQLYPEYIAKTKLYYIKKSSNDLVLERMPNIMNKYFSICAKLHINLDDDF